MRMNTASRVKVRVRGFDAVDIVQLNVIVRFENRLKGSTNEIRAFLLRREEERVSQEPGVDDEGVRRRNFSRDKKFIRKIAFQPLASAPHTAI